VQKITLFEIGGFKSHLYIFGPKRCFFLYASQQSFHSKNNKSCFRQRHIHFYHEHCRCDCRQQSGGFEKHPDCHCRLNLCRRTRSRRSPIGRLDA
jgi:hypothetical protein